MYLFVNILYCIPVSNSDVILNAWRELFIRCMYTRASFAVGLLH